MPRARRIHSLADFLEHELSFHHVVNFLPSVIGDGYLMASSSIYANLRRAALAHGFRFSDSPPFDYKSFPLMCLPHILETKIIPYSPSFDALVRVEEKSPGRMKFSDFAFVHPEGNFLAHESAHAVADVAFKHARAFSVSRSKRRDLIEVMIGEAFANATELTIAGTMNRSSLNVWYLRLTNYHQKAPKELSTLRKKIGEAAALKVTVLLYLCSNFLYRDLNQPQINMLLELCQVSLQIRRDKEFKNAFRVLKRHACSLNPIFRLKTTALYLKASGFEGSPQRLLNFDPLAYLHAHDDLVSVVDRLVLLATDHEENGSLELHSAA